jgi:YD repeat-containing protein
MGTTYFHWDPIDDCVTHESDGSGNTIVTYNREPGQFGPLLSETRSGTTYTHHYDALGSTTALTDAVGAVASAYTYDAAGAPVSSSGSASTIYEWNGRLGYQYSSQHQSYYVRQRYYVPTINRWLSSHSQRKTQKLADEEDVYSIRAITLLNSATGEGAMPLRSLAAPAPIPIEISALLPEEMNPVCPLPRAGIRYSYTLPRWPCVENVGYFIQRVGVSCFSATCVPPGEDNFSGAYFEAWQVNKMDEVFVIDFVGGESPGRLRGAYRQSGNMRFYCSPTPGVQPRPGELYQREEDEILNVNFHEGPPWWQPNLTFPCSTDAGGLQSIDGSSPPSFWQRSPAAGTSSRYFHMTWNCCCAPPEADADARPR